MKRFFTISVLSLAFFPLLAHAESTVVISEVAWAGSSASNADEWLELFNAGDAPMDISGWFLEGAASGETVLEFPEGAIVSASGTYLLANYDADSEKSTLDMPPDWATTAVSLSNSALHLVLRDADGMRIDEVGVSGEAPPAGHSGDIKASMTRITPEADGRLAESWLTSSESSGFDEGSSELGNPGTYAPSTPEDDDPAKDVPEEADAEEESRSGASAEPPLAGVRISEVFPAPPSGEEEWIELVNISSIGEFMDGWTIEDGAGRATRLEGLLLPWARVVIASPKGALNNGGDLVWLRDDRGRNLDGLTYGSWEDGRFPHLPAPGKGEALMREEFGEMFFVTRDPTPGEANLLTVEEPEAPPAAMTPKAVSATDDETAENDTELTRTERSAPETPAPAPSRPVDSSGDRGADRSVGKTAPDRVAPSALKEVAVTKRTKTSPPSRGRYKGSAYRAVIAVPPGVYSSARMRVIIGDQIRELRLTRSPSEPFAAGEVIGFVAQEKHDGGRGYLLANIKSVSRTGERSPITFPRSDRWPASSGPFELEGTVTEVAGETVMLETAGGIGLVESPMSLRDSGLQSGDRVAVKGFVEHGDLPRLILADAEAMRVLEPVAKADVAGPDAGVNRPLAFALLAAVIGAGLFAYLRHERIKRAALLAPAPDPEE